MERDYNYEFKVGDVVRFVDYDPDQVKWGSNDDPIKKGLVKNDYYTIDSVDVRSWHTKLTLKEKSGSFNSAHFQFIDHS
ncbi:MAG: hypothetical protein PHT94_00800 [Candidatus Nanoarchaeia archaeon]|nr:hypothetical protein [Candidatus Nanoarchaeia archaeon]